MHGMGHSMNRFKHLLVHLDLQGAHDRSAVRYASAVSQLGRSRRIEFIHTVPAQAVFAGLLNDSSARTTAWAQERYREFLGAIDLGGLEATFICRESPLVGPGILRQAGDQRSDLIVMGARGKDALSAALLGSTTAEVVRETRIPTLVVKAKGAGRSFLELLLGNP